MPQRGKNYVDAMKGFDRATAVAPSEAITQVKANAKAKFDETIELAMRLGVDPRKADQIVRGTVSLPGGTGQNVRVAVFADGPAAAEAREAGADVVGSDDLIEKVLGGFLDFDVAIATPDLMGKVGKAARILGPRKLMPNPKTGTVTPDVGKAVTEFKGGKVEYRTDKFGNIHVPIGKASFDQHRLLENFRAVIDEIQRAKPASAKGKYIRSVNVSPTMGPGVRIDTTRLRVTDDDLAAEAAARGEAPAEPVAAE